MLLVLLLLAALYVPSPLCAAAAAAVGSSPPRGFNSWNSYLQWASAADLLAQAEVMETAGLRAVNFSYVVADGGWYYDPVCGKDLGCEAIDHYGRLIPDSSRYPSGMKGLCDELHARGFKCGFHLFRGVSALGYTRASPIKGSEQGCVSSSHVPMLPQPSWLIRTGSRYTVADAGFSPTSNNSGIGPVGGHGAFFEINIQHPAAVQYLDSMFELYCSWGVDFIKLDGMGSSGAPSFASDGTRVAWPNGPRMNPRNGGVPVAKAYRAAIDKNCGGREVVLSLSAGGTGIPGWQNSSVHDMLTDEYVEAVQDVVQMTRVTPDTWDIWDDNQTSCPLAEHWANTMGPNRGAPDPKYRNVSGHSGCCWGGRIAQHFLEFAHVAHIADEFGVFPDGDMLQIGRVGSYPNLKPETLAQYASPKFTPNDCTIKQLTGNYTGGVNNGTGAWEYDTSLCPRQSYLTYEESKSLVTLWSIARSPLIMGGDLTRSPPEIISLLANRAVMEMNSHSEKAHEVLRDHASGACVWASTPQNVAAVDEQYVALFNLGPDAQRVHVAYSQLGMSTSGDIVATDMWKGERVNMDKDGVGSMIPRHGVVLLRLRHQAQQAVSVKSDDEIIVEQGPLTSYGLTVTDNKNNTMHGFARVVTVTSPNQFRISFSGTLQGCGDHIVDLVNDPRALNPLNPNPPGWSGDPGSTDTSYVWRTCLASELDNVAHNGYLDANMGTSIPRYMYPYMDKAWLDSLGTPLVEISVPIQSSVRVQIRTRTFWIGYNGNGPDKKLDANHTNEKTFTIYRDGKIYVESIDTLAVIGGPGEKGGASGEHGPTGANSAKSTFIHPINAKSHAGFTLGTNYSLDALSLYPRGGGLAKWLLQWGQDTQPDPYTKARCSKNCTAMNFLQVPLNSSCSISQSGSFDYTYFQPMQGSKPSWNAGYRWGVSPNALDFPAGSSYTKNFLYQLGTRGSSLLPNIVTMDAANSIATAYLQPARIMQGHLLAGEFDYSEGCYRVRNRLEIHAKQLLDPIQSNSIEFVLEAFSKVSQPAFCMDIWSPVGFMSTADLPTCSASIGGSKLLPQQISSAIETDRQLASTTTSALVAQLFRVLPAGRHEIRFECI